MNTKKAIFVYPNSLQFFYEDRNSHCQIISIYNQCDLKIRFKILTTAPKKYIVDESEGFINPKKTIELTIRHHTFVENSKDKLRIQIYSIQSDYQGNVIFKKDLPLDSIVSREKFIISSIHKESEINSDQREFSTTFTHGNNLNSRMGISSSSLKTRSIGRNDIESHNVETNVNYLVIFIGLICLTLIFMPVVGSADSNIPTYMHMTLEAKLFASFVLGNFFVTIRLI